MGIELSAFEADAGLGEPVPERPTAPYIARPPRTFADIVRDDERAKLAFNVATGVLIGLCCLMAADRFLVNGRGPWIGGL